MDFSTAFAQIRNKPELGMRLPHWSEEVRIKVQIPDEQSKNTVPYLYLESYNERVPWNMTNPELFSWEWQVLDKDGFYHE